MGQSVASQHLPPSCDLEHTLLQMVLTEKELQSHSSMCNLFLHGMWTAEFFHIPLSMYSNAGSQNFIFWMLCKRLWEKQSGSSCTSFCKMLQDKMCLRMQIFLFSTERSKPSHGMVKQLWNESKNFRMI